MSFAPCLARSCLRFVLLLSLLSATSHAAQNPPGPVSAADLLAAEALIAATTGFVESGQILVHLEFAQAQIEFWMKWSQC